MSTEQLAAYLATMDRQILTEAVGACPTVPDLYPTISRWTPPTNEGNG